MQRDDWYSAHCKPSRLADPAALGRYAAERALSRLGSRRLSTRTAPVLFDETPVGLRRRRSMIEGMQRLEAQADAIGRTGSPALDAITAVTLHDYQQLRFADQPWLPATPRLKALAEACNALPAFDRTRPYIPA